MASAASEDAGSGGGAGRETKAGGEGEASALGESEGASGGGDADGGGGGGAWGLGWVKSRWERGSGQEGDGEEEEQEDCSEGSEEGPDSGEASSDPADDDATKVETLSDLVPGGKEEEASMEQRLGEAVLARAGDRYGVGMGAGVAPVVFRSSRSVFFASHLEMFMCLVGVLSILRCVVESATRN